MGTTVLFRRLLARCRVDKSQADLQDVVLSLKQVPETADIITVVAKVLLSSDTVLV